MSELDKIAERYERRKQIDPKQYSRFNPEVLASTQERQRVLVSLLKKSGVDSLRNTSIIEIGCGSGTNLLELMILGAMPENLVGNELLPDSINRARRILPESLRLSAGDASEIPIEPNSFDFVYQSMVFSSVLDDALQTRIAKSMWRWVKPGGGILWYDFIFNNPYNPDVRGVPLRRVKELFPDGLFIYRRVTLAPPISRRVCKINPMFYRVLNALPLLRSHVFCLIKKREI